ncbi:hypothetical protein ABZV65_19865 [Streptomyces bauhiniae]|uniref:hypothetical protein n=1 Tax=Streptomyces bauhiniae TaxID=2340725 RepID=UPI00339E435A
MSETPMTPERLAEIAARANAATRGPWCTDDWEIYHGLEYVPGMSLWIGETCTGTGTPERDRANATFMAAARTDVPDLLADNDRLRARVAELESQREADHATWRHDLRKAQDEREAKDSRISELEAGIAWRDAERARWMGVHDIVERAIDKGWSSVDTLDLEDALGAETGGAE